MNILERARAQREAIKVSNAGRTKNYKFKPGKTLISLLPLHSALEKPVAERDFNRSFGLHYLKNKKDEFVVAVGDRSITYGDDCPVRNGLVDMIRYGKEIGDDELAEQAQKSLARKSELVGIFVHKNTENKEEGPQLASFSETLFDQFLAIIEEYAAEDLELPLRWNERLTFVVEREGSTMNDTRYKVYPAAKRLSVDSSVMTTAVDIEKYVEAQFAESVAKALTYIGTITGKAVAGSTAAAALTGGVSRPALEAPVIEGKARIVEPTEPSVEDDEDDMMAAAPPPKKAGAPALASTRTEDAVFEDVPTVSDDDLMAEIDKLAA